MNDYIKKADVLKEAELMRPVISFNTDAREAVDVGKIISLPAADVEEVKHATWECIDKSDNVWECSGKYGCGEQCMLILGTPEDNNYKRCPNCGAKMDEKEQRNGQD